MEESLIVELAKRLTELEKQLELLKSGVPSTPTVFNVFDLNLKFTLYEGDLKDALIAITQEEITQYKYLISDYVEPDKKQLATNYGGH